VKLRRGGEENVIAHPLWLLIRKVRPFLTSGLILLAGAACGGVAGGILSGHPLVVLAARPAAAQVSQAPLRTLATAEARSPFVAAVARVRPAVVNISTERTIANPFGDLSQFFGPVPGIPSGPIQEQGVGSGVIVNSTGDILTNAHVVAGAQHLTVTLLNGRTYQGTVVGKDSVTDLAVVKIAGSGLPVAPLGDSSTLVPGDWAIAIGNPYGLNFTVTAGVISATGRTIPDGSDQSFLQTDAAINPGNSGGPLINTAGQVIGINTAEASNGQGLGFAIPINRAKRIMQQLLTTGYVPHPYIGVYVEPITAEAATAFHIPAGTHGAVVARVAPGSPAETAGLREGDVIEAVGGRPVADPQALVAAVHAGTVGRRLVLQVLRDGRTQTVTVTVEQMPSPPGG
jgi:S1-C subfamily serine protease